MGHKKQYIRKLENLIEGREDANIIDFKMGTSTVTYSIRENPNRMGKRLSKDKGSTTVSHGLRVIGYVIKNLERRVEEKFYKFPYKTKDDIPQVLRKVFSFPRSENMFESKLVQYEINREAQQFALGELQRLADFLANRSSRDIKGASILILLDHFARSYAVKIIDLSTIDVYSDPKQRD